MAAMNTNVTFKVSWFSQTWGRNLGGDPEYECWSLNIFKRLQKDFIEYRWALADHEEKRMMSSQSHVVLFVNYEPWSIYLDIIIKYFKPLFWLFVCPIYFILHYFGGRSPNRPRWTKCAGPLGTPPDANGQSWSEGQFHVCGPTQTDARGHFLWPKYVRPLEMPLLVSEPHTSLSRE
jgi:hypothetical protein